MGILEKSAAAHGQSARAASRAEQVMRSCIAAIGLCLMAAAGFAQNSEPSGAETTTVEPAPKAWSSLSPEQQQLLQSHQNDWNTLPPDRQQALARGSQRWLSMTPQQREGAQQRFTQWRALPPEQRQVIRHRWQRRSSRRGCAIHSTGSDRCRRSGARNCAGSGIK